MTAPARAAMAFDEYRQYDATALADLVRRNEVTPAELLETAIARAEAVNPQLNTIVTPLYDRGRDMANKLPGVGPFRGVPFLLKDLELDWEGTPLKLGCTGYKNFVSTIDSEVVTRLKQAGLVLFGKTNTPEFGLTPYTEATLYGPARNPWNTTYSPGGSSGGSAVAVSAGIVPMASASDGGGSIRIPASCCGLFGLKPSRGRVPLGPRNGEMWSGAVVTHALTRSVRDSAALLDAISGTMSGEPYFLPVSGRSFLAESRREPGQLRIGFSTETLIPSQPVHPECIKAVQDAAKLLESLGHTVEEIKLPYNKTVLTEAFFTMVLSETAASLRELGDYLGRPTSRSDVELNTWALARMAEAFTGTDYAYQKRRWNGLSRSMAELHDHYDVILTPTLPRPPLAIGEFQNKPAEDRILKILDRLGALKRLKGGKVMDQLAEKAFGYISFTGIANMTGQPAMSMPLHWSAEGLPIGTMFTAMLGDEATLFRLAGQLEQAKPWFDLVPS